MKANKIGKDLVPDPDFEGELATPQIEGGPTPEEVIADHLATYRKLKSQADVYTKQMEALKPIIQELVEAHGGKYQDDIGYARMIVRSESVSFPGEQVDQLITTWAKSDNDIMKSCGQMLLNLRKTSQGYSYLQIK